MGFSETFLQGYHTGAQNKLQREAQAQQALRDKQRADLDLEQLKLQQAQSRIAQQKAQFDAELHPLELEKALTDAGLVPAEADAAGGAPGVGAAVGPLPPPAAPGSAPGASPLAPGATGEPLPPEPMPARTLQDLVNVGGKKYRRLTDTEKAKTLQMMTGAKVEGEESAKAKYNFLSEDLNIPGIGVIPKGTPINATSSVISGTAGIKEGAARNATQLATTKMLVDSREKVAEIKGTSSSALKKMGDGSWALASDIVAKLQGKDGTIPTTGPALSASSRNTIDKSAVLVDLKNDALAQLDDPEVAKHLGPVNGRITSVEQLIGNPDSGAQKLFGTLTGVAALAMGIHTFRSATEAARITDQYFKGRYEPAAIRGALEGITGAAQKWEALGRRHGYDVSATGPGATDTGVAAPPSGIVIKSIRPKTSTP